MARLSFIEQERIARNMTDADILGEYEQKGSVLPPGITMDQSVLLGEMEGRTYVRDATSAAETAANMQPGSTADQQVEKFKGGMQGVQQLLAMGPQQGMGSQGMPQQMGPQMAADGGVIGYQTGGQYGRVIDDPESIGSQASRMGMSRQDFEEFLQGGLPQEKIRDTVYFRCNRCAFWCSYRWRSLRRSNEGSSYNWSQLRPLPH
jgi:hypothetical protein